MAAVAGPIAVAVQRKVRVCVRGARVLALMQAGRGEGRGGQLAATLQPTVLELINDSAKHAGHAAMRGSPGATESHFRYTRGRLYPHMGAAETGRMRLGPLG
jgi:hypothetical protein